MPTEVDTSMYARPAQSNPFGVLSDVVSIQNAMNANRLFQQQMAARQAMGQIMSQSVDPKTGDVDYLSAATRLSTNPTTAPFAAQMINGWVTNQNLQQDTISKHLANAAAKTTLWANAASSLLPEGKAAGGQIQQKDLIAKLAEVQSSGAMTPDEALQVLQGMGSDPKEIYNHVLQAAMRGQDAAISLSNIYKQVTADTGGAIKYGSQNVYGGGVNVDSTLSKTATPGELNALQPIIGPNGEPMAAPRASVQPVFGGDMTQQQPGGAAEPRPAPVPQAPGGAAGTSILPPSVEAPPQAAAAAAPSGAGAVQTGLSPYKAEAIKEVATKYEPELNDRTKAANSLLLSFSQVQDELKHFKTGGGMTAFKKLGEAAQALGLPQDLVDQLSTVGDNGGGLGDVQAANKLFFSVASQVVAQLIKAGGGRMTQTEWGKGMIEGSPNIDMDPRGVQKVITAMKEAAHYTKMESDVFNIYKRRGGDLTQWQNEWQNILGAKIDAREQQSGQ